MENNEHQLNIEYCQKIEKLIKPFFQKSYERYIQIKDEIDYIIEGFPEFQMPKREIEICLLLGLDQAAITLLNHLVEKYLKTALIFRNSETNNEQSSVVETLQQSSKSAFEKYDGMELCSSINTACKQKLITKDDKEKLHRIRDCLRNAYAHAEQKKIHGNTKVPLTAILLT